MRDYKSQELNTILSADIPAPATAYALSVEWICIRTKQRYYFESMLSTNDF